MNEHAFSLTRGGPLYGLLHRAHLVDASGKPRALWLTAVAWVPFAIGALIDFALTGSLDKEAADIGIHARLLVMLPLLIAAENLLEQRCAAAARHAYEERIAHRASLEGIFGRATHLRDAWHPEAMILVLVIVGGQVVLRSWADVHHGGLTFARVWCFVIAVPLVQFLLVRWLWRWALWTYVLARIARLPLALDALHPDRAAGLALLGSPTDAFAVFLMAVMSMVSATWWDWIADGRTTLKSLGPHFVVLVVVAVVVACGPLVLFSRQLYRARHRDAAAYHVLAREYADAFRTKWLGPGTASREQVLGSPDIRSLSGLESSYEAAEDTRMFPFGLRTIITLCVGALLPLVPLVLAAAPILVTIQHLGKMMFEVAAG